MHGECRHITLFFSEREWKEKDAQHTKGEGGYLRKVGFLLYNNIHSMKILYIFIPWVLVLKARSDLQEYVVPMHLSRGKKRKSIALSPRLLSQSARKQ